MIFLQAALSFINVAGASLWMFFQVILGGLGLRYMERVGANEQLNIGVNKLYDTAQFMDRLYRDGTKKRSQMISNSGNWIMWRVMDFHLLTIRATFPMIRWAIRRYLNDNLLSHSQVIWLRN